MTAVFFEAPLREAFKALADLIVLLFPTELRRVVAGERLREGFCAMI